MGEENNNEYTVGQEIEVIEEIDPKEPPELPDMVLSIPVGTRGIIKEVIAATPEDPRGVLVKLKGLTDRGIKLLHLFEGDEHVPLSSIRPVEDKSDDEKKEGEH